MQNLTLEFEPDNSKAGFRLQRLEVLNWGTFNGAVWSIEPGGNTALLTGANGSGKSTLVDALLTLLVPNAKRNYNQAGAERRRERDERSYVLGAYGKVKAEDAYQARTQYLRTRDDYSVLLAVFSNAAFNQCITLAHVFWLEDDGVRKFFVIAQEALAIQTHFSNFTTIAELKKRLRGAGFEVYDEFARYSRRFCALVGLRSEKALDLFNQTVSIKEIGGLNDFVRGHMLERSDSRERIARLRANYENLTSAHDAILKAEQQLARLRPLIEDADRYMALAQKIQELKHTGDAVPGYFARRTIALLEQATAEAQVALEQARARKVVLESQLTELDTRKIDLHNAINRDQVGQQIRNLEKDIEHTKERKQRKQEQERRYSDLARKLKLPPYQGGESTFVANQQQARAALAPLEERLRKLESERDERKVQQARLQEVCAELETELHSLRQRKSQLPAEDLRVRSELLNALGLDESQAPFVGELLKVKETARGWEGAIERLLHSFGRQLLVEEAYYQRVSSYVNRTDLRGRLVFHRVTERRGTQASRSLDPDALPHKIEIKPDSAFHDWLRAELCESYNHICCEDETRFRQEHRAITRSGLIKSGGVRHEKDDRHRLDDRTRYVLGWDNRAKIREFESVLRQRQAEAQQIAADIARIEKEQRGREEQRQWLQQLLTFTSFELIDWLRDAAQIRALREQKQQLEQSSDRLKQLQRDLAALLDQIAQTQRARDEAARDETNRQRDLDEYAQRRSECDTRLSIVPPESIARYAPLVEARLKGEQITLENSRDLEAKTHDAIHRTIDNERWRLNKQRDSLINQMLEYKHAYSADTTDVDAAIEALDEFRRMLQTIERDDLPRHAKRFKELLDEKVVADIVYFKGALEEQEEAIRESISNLNLSLRRIDYTPSTYIELRCDATRDREVIEFKQMLRGCVPDVGQPSTPETNEASFQRIRALIERFENDERWTARVADVRNWLDFSASECYKGDGSEKSYYSDSSGKSGGQKAKLAYTILASAIAYQFGLDAEETRSNSFRFVVVDEAFSKSDEANARYAMELFKQLNLQLLVVTPLDKTHVVEPYIAACHFVANSPEENDSKVWNLTIAQYHVQKAALQAVPL
jgi:uncharacterized protein YPO0396